jgi:D-arabinitol 4-dehydrogenase
VLDRFSNPYIRDTIERVAADGFAKIPGFMTPTIAERLEHGHSFNGVAMLPALFLLFLQARAEGKIGFDYKDQAMDEAVVNAILTAPYVVHYFCANPLLWGPLASNSALEAGIANAYALASQWLAGDA